MLKVNIYLFMDILLFLCYHLRLHLFLQNIEQLISQTIIGKYYSPLPHTTYHMTLFNIYCMASSPIPPVQRWTLGNKENKIPEKIMVAGRCIKNKTYKST